ncbi:MAG TPA: hypothetical protein VFP84_40385 [Kofleriaceae bacterium]|nr:hypothetical protein [Kofleriaceae bacterium]
MTSPTPRALGLRALGLRVLVACALGCAATLAAACHADEVAEAPAPVVAPKDALTKTTENGPVKATLKVWPSKPALDEAVYAELSIDSPAGVTIDAPFQETGSQLGRFAVESFGHDTTRKPDGGQVHRQLYTLRAQASGRQRIPPLRFEMTDAGKAGSKPQEVLTDEVPLEITPISAEAAQTPLKPALGDLDPDVGGIGWFTALAIVFGVAIVGAGGTLAFRALRARRRIEQQRSAYDEAVAELRALEDRGPPDAATADHWFVTLSAIVRRYLEMRYEIRAPELTTEEFLLVATARPELTAEHRALLTSFLERCDRVKFAGYRPDADESIASLKAARGFVEDTRLREPIATAVARKAA